MKGGTCIDMKGGEGNRKATGKRVRTGAGKSTFLSLFINSVAMERTFVADRIPFRL